MPYLILYYIILFTQSGTASAASRAKREQWRNHRLLHGFPRVTSVVSVFRKETLPVVAITREASIRFLGAERNNNSNNHDNNETTTTNNNNDNNNNHDDNNDNKQPHTFITIIIIIIIIRRAPTTAKVAALETAKAQLEEDQEFLVELKEMLLCYSILYYNVI